MKPGDFFYIAPLLALALSCRPPSPTLPEMGRDRVARYGDILVSVEELDRFVLSLPPRERPLPGQDLDSWYEEKIRALILDRLLLKQAEEGGLRNDAAYLRARRSAERNLVLRLYLRPEARGLAPLEEADLKQAYEARKDQLQQGERRAVFHIYRRIDSPSAGEAVRSELSGLRDRVLQGENFQGLAQTHSDSESRHRDGSIGWIRRGMLDTAFEAVIFSLEEGVPSKPVLTEHGAHLFYVDTILPEKALTFEEAKPMLAEYLSQERRNRLLEEAVEGISPPPGAYFADRETFVQRVQEGEADAILLSLGDTEMSVGDFRAELEAAQAGGANQKHSNLVSMEQAWQTFQTFRKLVLLEFHCKKQQRIDLAELENQMATWDRNALIRLQRRKSLLALAKEDLPRLKLFYQGNIGHFSRPIRVKLRALKFPIDKNALEAMTRLETSAKAANADLEDLAGADGELVDLGWKSFSELNLIQPKLPGLLAALKPGQITAPFRTGGFIEVVELLEREEAEPLPFEDIVERVAAAYSERHERQLFQELSAKWLRPEKLEINPEGLAKMRERDLSETDVDAEDIEKLLQELGPTP